ncbi:hypothetical protein KFL_000780220 [Klebsormidium nitens]|uniref:Uncharacterized protein n=1 Tax=Klebsormidium nitens TaxID=105231 RepID=A0A1Y1HRV2_KLENI|nr:hypothetical protein KFL_000780220 [Klebsormidium nitens]|eukprot:GAQ81360.1 hypothetical protein KFL_000780220 [Klebsormidium nitens]
MTGVTAALLCALLCMGSAVEANPIKGLKVKGKEFSGKIDITSFKQSDGQLIAVGTCAGKKSKDNSDVSDTPCQMVVTDFNGVDPATLPKDGSGNRKLLAKKEKKTKAPTAPAETAATVADAAAVTPAPTTEAPTTAPVTTTAATTAPATTTAPTSSSIPASTSSCQVAKLSLQGLQLELLGLVVSIDQPVVITIDAIRGTVLGDLLCPLVSALVTPALATPSLSTVMVTLTQAVNAAP